MSLLLNDVIVLTREWIACASVRVVESSRGHCGTCRNVMKNKKFNETGENFVMVQLPFCSLVEPLLFCLMLLHSLVGCQNVMQSLPGLSCMCLFHPSDKSVDEIFHNCHRCFVPMDQKLTFVICVRALRQ